jgi:RNA polymerase sigma-70 factor (ECF subfamily)
MRDSVAPAPWYEKHRKDLVRLASQICGNQADAEDAVQDAVLKALATHSPFTGDSSFATWFHTVVRNNCFQLLRREHGSSKYGPREFVELSEWEHSEPSCERAVAAREEAAHLLQRAKKLTPKRQRVFTMHFLYEMKPREIASELRAKRSTVQSLLHHCRRELVGDASESRY